ncbi:hypothetical protein HWV62_14816 [Athelia sp. TMB]|nr:hypothetical protein HWV62_14816 [Athelia sp. TMB]
MGLSNETSAALVFLVLYAILFITLILGYLTRQLGLRSRYTILAFHITIRLASQATGLAFGIVGFANYRLLVAYFVLGAEGYFTLVYCAFRFLISWQNHNSATHDSWLEPRRPKGQPFLQRLQQSLTLSGSSGGSPMSTIHVLLIAANTIIVVGGSLLAGGDMVQFYKNLLTSKGLRVTGQAIFLLINIFLLYCLVRTINEARRENPGQRVHPTLLLLLAAWPLLFVRGIYGVLAGLLPTFNYFDPGNHTDTGLTNSFVASEYVLGTAMEWTSCLLLLSTWYTSRKDPKKAELEMMGIGSRTGVSGPASDLEANLAGK